MKQIQENILDTQNKIIVINGESFRFSRVIEKIDDSLSFRYGIGHAKDIHDKSRVASALMHFEENNCEHVEFLKEWGFENVPEQMFYLDFISVVSDYQNKNIGSTLLNLVLEDIEKYNQKNGSNIPLLFLKVNNGKNDNFYNRFGARLNDSRKDYKFQDDWCMIMNAKTKEVYQAKNGCIFKVFANSKDQECTKQY